MADIEKQVENNEVIDYAKKHQQAIAGGTSTKDQILTTSTVAVPQYTPPRNVQEFIAQNPEGVESPEEKQKRLKRERTNKTIAGISDMLSALSNMYFATKGAPSSFDPRNGMTAKMVERYDQLDKEREAREREYKSGLERARQLDLQYSLSWQNLKNQEARWRQQEEERKQKEKEAKAKAQALEEKQNRQEEARRNMAIYKNDPGMLAYWNVKYYGGNDAEAEAAKNNAIQAYKIKQAQKNRSKGRSKAKPNNTTDPYAKYLRK